MNSLRYTLLSDGGGDQKLLSVLDWVLRQHFPRCAVNGDWADTGRLRSPPRGLPEKIERAIELYPCDVLFIHRDAENQSPGSRISEIDNAVQNSSHQQGQYVHVIPVRMTEAWLLFDEAAIRFASGNPNGGVHLDVPRAPELESIPDPKSVLRDLLLQASELRGRRRKRFRGASAARLVAERIVDYRPLRVLPAFAALEDEVRLLAAKLQPRRP